MLHSIRLRLLLTVGLAVAIALFAVGFLASRATRREFAHFVAFQIAVDASQVPRVTTERLEEHYRAHRSWSGVKDILNGLVGKQGRLQAMVIMDSAGCVAGASDSGLFYARSFMKADSVRLYGCPVPGPNIVRREIVRMGGSPTILQDEAGDTIGKLLSIPLPPAEQQPARDFLHSINRWLLLLVLGAGLLALGSTALVARRILHPVEELTAIAREMGQGDLSRRATIRSKDEIGELGVAFNTMADGLARIERLRRNMVQDVAHELRTPLTSIRCQLEAIQDGLAQVDRATIDSLHEEILGLGSLVESLQDLALAESGQLRLTVQPLTLSSEVERVVRTLTPPGTRGGPEIRLALPPDLPPVQADPERLAQILRNLLQNALTHTPPGGTIRIAAQPVTPSFSATGTHLVEISVADTGSGIASEDLPFLFERFYRSDPSRQRLTGGAGLGLAITRQLVEAHGGSIRAESSPGEGATFLFTLPVAWSRIPPHPRS
jgi:signal transduction histidine kinase